MNGEGLRAAIFDSMKTSLEDYIKWKQQYTANVGYENGREIVNFTLLLPDDEKDPVEYLVDHSLGLKPALKVSNVETKDIRFGIEAPKSSKFLESAQLEFGGHPKFRNGVVKIRHVDEFNSVQFRNMEVYIPQGFNFNLEDKYKKIRFSAPYIDFVFNPSKLTVKWNLDWWEDDKLLKLTDIYPVSKMLNLLFEASEAEENVEIEWIVDEKRAIAQVPAEDFKLNNSLWTEIKLLNQAWAISKYFDVQIDAQVNIADLHRHQKLLSIMFQFLVGDGLRWRVTHPYKGDIEHGIAFCPVALAVRFSNYFCFVVLAIVGSLRMSKIDGQKVWLMDSSDVKIHRKGVIEPNRNARQKMRSVLKKIISDNEADKFVLLTPEMYEFLKSND